MRDVKGLPSENVSSTVIERRIKKRDNLREANKGRFLRAGSTFPIAQSLQFLDSAAANAYKRITSAADYRLTEARRRINGTAFVLSVHTRLRKTTRHGYPFSKAFKPVLIFHWRKSR